ncbi:MAG TPA: hypothetical protein VHY37_10765 [Tepidisphaeraceae bacterium]|jgi:hypothetical protein|nr:hypothetical protein [Tepidisphaeraceae bacterium]
MRQDLPDGTDNIQIAFDIPAPLEVVVPNGLTDEGVLAGFIGLSLQIAGNPLFARARYSFHVGNGVFEFRDEKALEFWLVHIGADGFQVRRVPEQLVAGGH